MPRGEYFVGNRAVRCERVSRAMITLRTRQARRPRYLSDCHDATCGQRAVGPAPSVRSILRLSCTESVQRARALRLRQGSFDRRDTIRFASAPGTQMTTTFAPAGPVL